MSLKLEDTIAAIATPPGRSALSVIRMSGPAAFEIGRKHIRPWPARARTAYLSGVLSEELLLDEALVILFPGPDSFTGEDTLEISAHGGYVVPASILAVLISSGARQATGGEFTRRAVLNGKLDLLQAEAIGDLIDAQSRGMQETALAQLDGGLSRRLLGLRENLLDLEALLAYDIDFPEEDDGPIASEKIEVATATLIDSIRSLLATAPAGELIREGAVVVIAGPPNAGKSSLFNALLGRSRAIVTEIPGTTRDALEAVIDNGKFPLRIVDTAGLRDSVDPIERLGIEVSERYLAAAHVILACAETREELDRTSLKIAERSAAPVIPVRTKIDLVANDDQLACRTEIGVSAPNGTGLSRLLAAIEDIVETSYGEVPVDLPILTRARHFRALSLALEEIEAFRQGWVESNLPVSIASVHLRAAVHALEELVGAVDVEDVLDRVFSSFCVGK
ncbi:MAG: tRNA uridine-5-carboxymethylaminomethyl(34) synthesis GTPase MnmE [Gemmatimonadaceae bacterium]